MLTDVGKLVTLDERVNEASLAVLRAAAAVDLDAPTPCADWTVRELLTHMSTQHHGFAASARGNGASEEVWLVGPATGDPVAGYAASVADVTAAFLRLTEETRFALPELSTTTTFPAVQAVSFHLVDGIAHGWDLARALGVAYDLDRDVLDTGWHIAQLVPTGDARLQPGAVFGPTVPVPATAPLLDRVLGALGRSPDWSPPG